MSDQPTPSAVNNAATLQRLRENGIHSVFDVVREGRGAFVARMAGSSGEAEARQLYDLAMQRASGLARLHTSLLARDEPTHRALPKLASGGSRERMESLSLSESGDFESWFGQAGLFPAPDSVASLFSPASYLVDLYRVAKKLHATTSEYHIDKRRPDLATLTLSQASMDTELPTLDLVNEILADGIEANTAGAEGADDLIGEARYPFGLPYDAHADEITLGLQALGTNEHQVHGLLKLSDPAPLYPPPFKLPDEQIRAQLGLSPGEYAIFMEALPSSEGTAEAWGGAYPKNARELVEKSGLTLGDIHDVLGSDRAFKDGATTASNPLVYGARYLNQGLTGTVPPTLNLIVATTDTDGYGTLQNATRWETFDHLHRMIRVKAHLPLSYEELDWIWAQAGISEHSPYLRLALVARYLPLRERFHLSVDAFVAIFGVINRHARAGKISFLDQLFQPGFATFFDKDADFGTDATMDGTTVPGRLAKGLGIDQQTLRKLALLVADAGDGPKVTIHVTEAFVACLYRLVEIPRLVGFSVDEGLALWSCMGYDLTTLVRAMASPLGQVLIQEVGQILDRSVATADWLHEQTIDIPTLRALVATTHRSVATEDIRQFIANIRATGSGDTVRIGATAIEDPVIDDQLARHVGAQFNLTLGSARAMIRWIDKVIGAMDADLVDYSSMKFWTDIAGPGRNSFPLSLEDISPQVVKYCHVLGQFALICHLTGLQEQDIALIVAPDDGVSHLYPYPGSAGHVVPPLNFNTIFWLYIYAKWREALPGSVAEARLHFGNSSVTGPLYKIADFAMLNGWNPEIATQVWTILGHTTLADMRQAYEWAGWMKVATELQLSPDNLKVLLALIGATDMAVAAELRKALAPAILGAVRAVKGDSKASALAGLLAEYRRDALLRYYLHHVVPTALKPNIRTPDDLYEYMLIDPQVSAKVKTSRIAEAIASVQLYMHRCREGLEPDVDDAALANEMRPGGYFSFWDAYNKGYGTWAGLQRLLRYPASYIDPSLRYTKTTPFRSLEDSLNQGRLTAQRADEAFASFVEDICDSLDIMCIDGFQLGEGAAPIVFLGKSRGASVRYFWRRTDPETTENPQDWTEWQPIDVDIPLYETEGEQPSIVHFAGAIRVVWWTWKSTGITNAAGEIEESYRMQLHIATLGYDQTWRTRDYPEEAMWHYSPKDAYVTTSGDDESEILHFIAAKDRSPIFGSVRVFDRFLNMSVGDTDSRHYDLELPTRVDGNLLVERHVRRKMKAAGLNTLRATIGGDSHTVELLSRVRATTWRDEVSVISKEKGSVKLTLTIPSGALNVGFDFVEADTFQTTFLSERLSTVTGGTLTFTPAEGSSLTASVTMLIEPGWTESDKAMDSIREWKTSPGYWSLARSHLDRIVAFSTYAPPMFRRKLMDGIDSLLAYATQNAAVEPAGVVTDRRIPWIAAVGTYMWELFFHAPFLIACRLLDEQRFDDAERWLRRIFSPSGYVDGDGNLELDHLGNVLYWNVFPLQKDTAWGPVTSVGTDDPDAVAMADPMHYKLAVYQRWMQLYMDRGDMAYRQQTRDSLTEAKMWYTQASQLLGRRPYFHGLLPGYWKDPSLATAATETAPALDALEAIVGDSDVPLPPAHPGQVRIVDGVFLPPVDDGSLVWWDRFAQRLYNLRHGLSLDGQPMSLPLYETPVSPRELQLRRLAADGGASGLDPSMVAMPSQRFTSLLDRARGAVQQLMQFGANLQGILERRDADALTVLQQTQQIDIQAMAKEIHTFQIRMLEHNAAGLDAAKAQAHERQSHYGRLFSEYMNPAEIASMGLRTTAPFLLQYSVGATVTAAALDMMPNTWIAGMAAGVGGTTWSAVARAVAEGITTEANALEMIAGNLDMAAGFERRAEEWRLQADQAAREVAQLDAQIDAGKAAIDQAMKQATHMEIEQGFAQAVLDVLTTRFSGKDLFSWQSSRMSTLYYQLYDATLSLCGWAQQAYQFETQDNTAFLQPGAWDDRYQGLLAGESLALCLQRLERAYLFWDQRVMEVERTLSLGALAEKPLGELIAEALDTAQGAGVSGKLTVGYEADVLALTFTLADAGIGSDYPEAMKLGTLRRIKSIAVTLPAVLGAYEDVRAVLGYAGGAAATLPSGCTAVTLSRGVVDHGAFMFDFNDGKYLPFEGIPVDDTGTLSLRFPNAPERPQEDMLRSINDVILHVRYTILRE